MEWWLQAQRWGFKFDPTEVQLISAYLYPKVRRWGGLCDSIGISDLVYTKPPWEYHSCAAFPGGEKYYCFTELKKMNQNQNRVVRTVGSYGTWHESNSKKIYGGNNYINNNNWIIGFKKLLNFKEKGEGTDWLMHEYSLPEKETNLVLCVIQKKKKKKEEMGSAYDTYLELDRGCRIEMVSFLDLFSTTSAGGDPCPGPVPAHDDHVELQALDLEEEETRPSKKLRSDPKFDDEPFSGADPCPAPAPAHAHDDDFEVSKSTASAGGAPCPVSGGVPCPAPAPAPAPAHDNHLELQVLDSEEEETRPSKKMRSDPKLVDHPVSVASSSVVDLPQDYWDNFAADLMVDGPDFGEDESGLLDFSGLCDDVRGLPNAVFGFPD